MLVFVGQILRVNTNGPAALFASIGKDRLVTRDAVGVLIPQHVALSGQALVALPTAKVLSMPILVHGLSVLATENEPKRFLRLRSLITRTSSVSFTMIFIAIVFATSTFITLHFS